MGWFSGMWWKKPQLQLAQSGEKPGGYHRQVTATGAMQVSAWWACVRLIAETISTLPLGLFAKEANNGRKNADHPLYALLHDSPNGDQTACEFWEGMVLSLCIYGNAYAMIIRGTGNRLIAIVPVNSAPEAMTLTRTANGALRYNFLYRGKRYDLGEDEMFHIRGFGDGTDQGLSPVAFAYRTLGLSDALQASAAATFRNGLKASVFFTAPPNVKLTSDQRKEFKTNFIDPYTGADATASAGLLEHGFDVKPVSLQPRDAEMLLSIKFNVEDICRWHRVPPVLVGHSADGQTMWGSGIEQIMLGWLTLGLRPYLTRIEQAIKKRLLTPVERQTLYAEFNVDGLLRADSAGRAAMLSSLAQNGFISRDEGRALDNRAPMGGNAAVLTVQSNMLPLDKLGTAAVATPDQQLKSALANSLFGGNVEDVIDQRIQSTLAKLEATKDQT